ncbi:unnamed protein product [Phaedon cochleariae]|uniref:Sodium/nucleoside cotransporter n=1 Tax=Phaedon cochleariae TaxID=80249 RepID=A0A9N9SEE5_PHACE|nr:unnamed protein product [Phaedon cochleariae]
MNNSSTETLETVLSDDILEEPDNKIDVEEPSRVNGKKNVTRKPSVWVKTSNWSKKHSSRITKWTVFSIFSAFFAWATSYYFSETENVSDNFTDTLCTGYGMLVILFGFYIFGFCYSIFINPVVVPLINKSIYKPLVNILTGIRYGSTIFYVAILAAFLIYLGFDTNENRNRLIPISGLVLFILIGFLFSHNKSAIQWRVVIWGLILQFLFGLLTIRWEVGRNILQCCGDKVDILLNYAFQGAEFAYGSTIIKENVFAFKALSTVYFVGFLVNVLYYYGIMQKVIGAIGNFLQWIMGTSICESVNSAANIFLGLSEAPLLLAPYLKSLTDSELHSIMTSGFATVSGSVMAAYINYGARAQDLITSSIMSAPAALCFSKMMYPETETIKVHKENIQAVDVEYESVLDAASKGASAAIGMVHGIVASVIAFLATVYLINGLLGWCGLLVGFSDPTWSLELITGKIFIPVSFVMGVPWEECESVGTLIGIKTMVNEFVAFAKMHEMIEAGQLSARTRVIATYAICGFSNPGSIGITISSLGALIPSKREVVTRLVFRAWFGGAMVCFMTACIAGALMPDDAL